MQYSKEKKVKGLEGKKCYIIFKQHERIYRKILELFSNFSNVTVNMINSEKSVVFLHTSNKVEDKYFFKKRSHSLSYQKKIRSLSISLAKDKQTLYTEKYFFNNLLKIT